MNPKKEDSIIITESTAAVEKKKSKRITSGYKNKQDRETFGKIYLDWRKSIDGNEIAAEDIGKAGTKSTMDEVWTCVERGKSEGNLKKPFYVVIIMRSERLMPGFGRQQFAYRESCPTPTYLQTVFRYTPADNKLEYLWALPTKNRCMQMYTNKALVPLSEYELLTHVIDFFEGKLDRMAQGLNGELYIDPLSNIF